MEVSSYLERIIVPYSYDRIGNKMDINRASGLISNKSDFESYLRTPEMPFAQDLSFQVQKEEVSILELEEVGEFGYILVDLKVEGGTKLNEKNLFALVSRTNEWVRFRLGIANLQNSIGYVYSVLILTEGDPEMKQELNSNGRLLTQLIPGIMRPGVVPDANYVKGVVSPDFGTTMTESYRFSLRGALIFDRNYASAKQYIEKQLIPTVAKLRSAQTFFEMLNRQLNQRLGQNPDKLSESSSKELGRLKEAILRSLAAAEHSQSFYQILEVSNQLKEYFGLTALQSNISSKVDVLDSLLQQKSDEKAQKTNWILGAATLALAIIALPQLPTIWNWLVKLIFGR